MRENVKERSGEAGDAAERIAYYRFAEGIREVESPYTIAYRQCHCYLTPLHIVDRSRQMEVFQIADIRQLYGIRRRVRVEAKRSVFGHRYEYRTEFWLAAVLADQTTHLFACSPSEEPASCHAEILRRLMLRNTKIQIEMTCRAGDPVSRLDGFYRDEAEDEF